jgi:uncharacterized membrane protein YqjE
MNNNAEHNHTTRNLAAIAAELKQELKEFTETRIEIFKSELREKLGHWKTALPIAGVGLALLVAAFLLITGSLVALAAVLIGETAFRWFFAFLAVGALWSLLGGLALYLAIQEFRPNRVMPRRTIDVLKEDKAWLQREARSQT